MLVNNFVIVVVTNPDHYLSQQVDTGFRSHSGNLSRRTATKLEQKIKPIYNLKKNLFTGFGSSTTSLLLCLGTCLESDVEEETVQNKIRDKTIQPENQMTNLETD